MKKINLKFIFILLAIIGLLIFLYFTNALSPIKEKIYHVFNPVTSSLYSFSFNIKNTYKTQTNKKNLAEEVKDLEKKVNSLIAENARLENLEDENKKLKEHLDFIEENKIEYIMARVISRGFSVSPEESENDILLNKGRLDGIKIGSAVVNSEGILVGKVSKVEEKISRATLTTNSNCKLAATIQNIDRTIGIANGKLGLTINMDFISQDEEINVGDLVVTSGLEEHIIRGLVIGRVSKIDSDSNEIWKSVIVEPLVNFDDLIIVSVLSS